MLAINKTEAEAIRKRFPDAHIVRTMKQRSKRHRYYCEETSKVLNLIDSLRADESDSTRGGVYYTGRR